MTCVCGTTRGDLDPLGGVTRLNLEATQICDLRKTDLDSVALDSGTDDGLLEMFVLDLRFDYGVPMGLPFLVAGHPSKHGYVKAMQAAWACPSGAGKILRRAGGAWIRLYYARFAAG